LADNCRVANYGALFLGLNGKLWLDRVGHPHSDQMHIVEPIQRVDEKTLQVDFTFDDPKSYTKAWSATLTGSFYALAARPDCGVSISESEGAANS
jgi:hypothetical protein